MVDRVGLLGVGAAPGTGDSALVLGKVSVVYIPPNTYSLPLRVLLDLEEVPLGDDRPGNDRARACRLYTCDAADELTR